MPYWVESDTFHADAVWEALAGGNADRLDQLQAAYCRLKSLASHLLSNGYLMEQAALRHCRGRRWILDRLCTPVLGEPALLHRPDDECDCLGDAPWTDGYAYRIHAFLKSNPSKREYNRNRAQKADLRDARLKDLVYRRDGGCCRYCTSGPLSPKAGRSKDRRKILHYDHVDPDQIAGPNGENLVVACARCNEHKGRRTPPEADMVLLPAPAPDVAAAMNHRDQELHDLPPKNTGGSATDHRRNTDESPTEHRPSADPVTDPITDRISDPVSDPNTDPTPSVRPSPIRTPSETAPDQGRGGSGLGRGGQPDLIPPLPPYPGQPSRSPAHPDVYTRRSRAAPAEHGPEPPPPEYRWPSGSVPADPPKDQR